MISAKNIVYLNCTSHHADFHTRKKKISKLQGNAKAIKENRFYFYLSVVFYVEAKCETVWTSTLHQGWVAPFIKDVGGHEPFTSFFSSLFIEFIVS